MTTILTIILLIIILFGSHYNAFLFGYEKGRYDLLKELDEGIERMRKDIEKQRPDKERVKKMEARIYDFLQEENDSD